MEVILKYKPILINHKDLHILSSFFLFYINLKITFTFLFGKSIDALYKLQSG